MYVGYTLFGTELYCCGFVLVEFIRRLLCTLLGTYYLPTSYYSSVNYFLASTYLNSRRKVRGPDEFIYLLLLIQKTSELRR